MVTTDILINGESRKVSISGIKGSDRKELLEMMTKFADLIDGDENIKNVKDLMKINEFFKYILGESNQIKSKLDPNLKLILHVKNKL